MVDVMVTERLESFDDLEGDTCVFDHVAGLVCINDTIQDHFQPDDVCGPECWPAPFDALWTVLLAVFFALCIVATTAGNVLVLLSFVVERQVRVPANFFMASLAITDVLIGTVSMPFYTVYVLVGYWPQELGPLLCDLWLSVDYTVCLVSQFTVLLITVDRFCSVRMAATYRAWRTGPRVAFMLAITWLVPAILFFGSIFGWEHVIGYRDLRPGECMVQFLKDPVFNTSLIVAYYFIPLIILCVLYAFIFEAAWRLGQKSVRKERERQRLLAMAASNTAVGIAAAAISFANNNKKDDDNNEEKEDDDDGKQEKHSNAASQRYPSANTFKDNDEDDDDEDDDDEDNDDGDNDDDDDESNNTNEKEPFLQTNRVLHPERSQYRGLACSTLLPRPSSTMLYGNKDRSAMLAAPPPQFDDSPDVELINRASRPHTLHLRLDSNTFSDNNVYCIKNGQNNELDTMDEIKTIKEGSEMKKSCSFCSARFSSSPSGTSPGCPTSSSSSSCGDKCEGHTPMRCSTLVLNVSSASKATQISPTSVIEMCAAAAKWQAEFRRSNNENGQNKRRRSCKQLEITANIETNFKPIIEDKCSGNIEKIVESPEMNGLKETNINGSRNENRLEMKQGSSVSFDTTATTRTTATTSVSQSKGSSVRSNGAAGSSVSERTDAIDADPKETTKDETETTVEENPCSNRRSAKSSLTQGRDELMRRLGRRIVFGRRSRRSNKQKCENRARKALRTISIILGAFVACWTPYHILAIIVSFCPDCINVHLYMFSYFLCYLNSPINPLCYATSNLQFKNAFKRILRGDLTLK